MEAPNSWMGVEPVNAYKRHWAHCFPSFEDQIMNLADSEVDAPFILSLVPF